MMDSPTDERPLDVLALEPWLGGSHAAFLEGWAARSTHRVELEGLAPRHWKWRMRSSAWELARRLRGRAAPDVLLATGYLDLPAFLGFAPPGWGRVPVLLYLHENQLTYPADPARPGSERDTSYGFTNLLSCLRAERVVFNSRFHLEELRTAAEELLRRLPRPNPRAELGAKLEDARVVAPGIELDALPLGAGGAPGAPLQVLFPHRWEHDKDPRAFLEACLAARAEGARFELLLTGEGRDDGPPGCAAALGELAEAVAHRGHLPRADYLHLLGSADLVVSSARHEFFGLAVAEALAAGAAPLLPRRLAYPEVLGPTPPAGALYDGPEELVRGLLRHAADPGALREPTARAAWRRRMEPWSMETSALALDTLCRELAAPAPRR